MKYIKLTTNPSSNCRCKSLVNWDAVKLVTTNPNLKRYPTAISFINTGDGDSFPLICEETTDQIAEQLDTMED